MGNEINNEMKSTIELEARRIIGAEVKSYREHLEAQFSFLKWSIGIIASFFAIIFVFFLGRSWLEMENTIQGKVDAVLVERNIQSRLTEQALNLTQSEQTLKAIDDKIGEIIKSRSLESLNAVIQEKKGELLDTQVKELYRGAPIGSIIASALTPELMNATGGGDWILADGRPISKDIPYAQITGKKKVPDLRGLFLRGINAGRQGEFSDPSGERLVGSEQADEMRSHTHKIGTSGADSFTMAPGGVTQRLAHFLNDQYGGGGPKISGSCGGVEVRPRNAAVYYYIKIR